MLQHHRTRPASGVPAQMRPIIYPRTAPHDTVDFTTKEKKEEEIEREDPTDFGRKEADSELFAVQKLVSWLEKL